MAISYPISLLNISAENTATTSKTLSVLSTTAVEGLSTLNEAPYAMSEFNGYTHTLPFVMSNPIKQSSAGLGLEVSDTCTDCSSNSTNISFRVRRVSGNTYFEVKSTNNDNNVKAWYTAAGNATTIGTSYTTIGTMTGAQNNSITAMKMDWSTSHASTSTGDSTFTAVDNSWRTLTNAYNSLGVKFSVAANNSGLQGDSDVDSAGGTMNIYMRGTGYLDTLVSSISYSCFARATANDSACFPAGSMVTLADGSIKTIETVVVGEELLGNEGSVNTVLELKHHESEPRDMHAITGPNVNTSLKFAPAHPLLTTDGWKAIDPVGALELHPEMVITQLEIGDILIKYSHHTGVRYEEPVQSIVSSYEDIPLYNFDVSGNDTYIVDEYVVHNK
jgi:hypothetical protein